MSLQQALLMTKFTAPIPPSANFIGGMVFVGGSTINYPSGTNVGDLAVLMTASFASDGGVPSGFTTTFSPITDGYSYTRVMSYKVISDPNEAIATVGDGTFDGSLVVLRGPKKLSPLFDWGDVGSGGSDTLVAPVAGYVIVTASDRGATDFPTITPATVNGFTGSGGPYFSCRTNIYPGALVNSSYGVTDCPDPYNTLGLLAVAIP